jgi:hypothetical protein
MSGTGEAVADLLQGSIFGTVQTICAQDQNYTLLQLYADEYEPQYLNPKECAT